MRRHGRHRTGLAGDATERGAGYAADRLFDQWRVRRLWRADFGCGPGGAETAMVQRLRSKLDAATPWARSLARAARRAYRPKSRADNRRNSHDPAQYLRSSGRPSRASG